MPIAALFNYRGRIAFSFLLVFFVIHQSLSAAESGSIRGRVFDRDTGDPLPGANVVIQNTGIGVGTDLDGRFYLRSVPAGNQTLRVSYIGYVPSTLEVTVAEDVVLEQDFRMTAQALTGETVIVTAQAKGQVAAINQQLSSNTIKNVVSEQRIQELPDFNAAEALGRLPGVSTQRSSGEGSKVVIRGISPQYNLVAVNGVRIASTDTSDRSVDLSMITPNMLRTIEVFKALTPDMDADAIGGYVNMQLREAPAGLHTDLLWQSGYTKYKKEYSNYKAVGSVSERFFEDDLGVFLLGNIEKVDRGADNYNATYGIRSEKSPDQQYADVYLNQMGLRRHYETRSRYGANVILDYKMPAGKLMAVNLFSRMNQDYTDFITQYDVQNNRLVHTISKGETDTDILTNALQGEYDFGFMLANLDVSNAYSRKHSPDDIHTYGFWQESAFAAGFAARNVQPEVVVANARPHIDDWVDELNRPQNGTYLYSVGERNGDSDERALTISSNLTFPIGYGSFASGYLKVGGKFRYTTRNNDQFAVGPPGGLPIYYGGQQYMKDVILANFPDLLYKPTNQSRFYASNFTNSNSSTWTDFLSNRFGDLMWAPQLDRLDAIVSMFDNNRDSLFLVRSFWASGPVQSLSNDDHYLERYSAAYVMTEINIGSDLMLLGGARYENDDRSFRAFQMKDGGDGTGYAVVTQPFKDVTAPSNDHYILPMAHARYKATDWADIRYAFTKTLSRPAYYALTPRIFINQVGNVVTAGNPDLRPAISFNHDLILSFYSNDIGLLTVGGFYKTVHDFIWNTTYPMQTQPVPGYKWIGDYPGAQGGAYLTSYFNNPNKAFIKGVELDWQTRFWYLPFPLDGIVLNVNYTHAWSSTYYSSVLVKTVPIARPPFTQTILSDTSRSGRLQDQPSDLVNASFGYDYGKFSGRVSLLYTSSTVRSVATRDELDSETKEFLRVDVALKQTLPWFGLQLYLNLNNINNRSDEAIQKTINAPTLQQFYGFTADLGIRYTI